MNGSTAAVGAWFSPSSRIGSLLFFFFQAEDGIRDRNVTGVQTCALPICCPGGSGGDGGGGAVDGGPGGGAIMFASHASITVNAAIEASGGGGGGGAQSKEIGRASCREGG